MNKSKATLAASSRIIPPDSLLKFGYNPGGGIEFDSASALLSFSYSGAVKADIAALGLAVRDGSGIVVGHTDQITAPSTSELQVLGTSSDDSSMILGRWSADTAPPAISFVKSRDPEIFDGSYAIVNDGDDLGRVTWWGDDGTDLNTPAARILVEVDGTPGSNDMPGRMSFHTTPNGSASLAERLRIDNAGGIFIGDTTNANMARGLTINQGANDDEILTLKSSDIAHGMTTRTETDTYGAFYKQSSSAGGLVIAGWGESSEPAVLIEAANVTDNTSKDSTALAPIVLSTAKKSGTSTGGVGANGNLFVVRTAGATKFIVDEDGDYLYDGTGAAYDTHDDLSLVRSIDREYSSNVIDSKWDEFATYNKSDLADLGIVHESGFVSGKRLAKLHNGAIWQLNTKHMSLVERVDSMSLELEAAISQLAALAAPSSI